METSDRLQVIREQLTRTVSLPSQNPRVSLVALQAKILMRSAMDQDAALTEPPIAGLLGGSIATTDDLRVFLRDALPAAGGKLSEDDDGYFNLALSPTLKDQSNSSAQSYRGAFGPSAPADGIQRYTVSDQPVAGVLTALAGRESGTLSARRSPAGCAGLGLEILYSIQVAADPPLSRLVRHQVTQSLEVTASVVTAWSYKDEAIDSHIDEWFAAAATKSVDAVEENVTALGPESSVTIDLVHCGLVEGPQCV